MKSVFIDTSAWLAIYHKSDIFHSIAVNLNKAILKKVYRFITTNYIFDEAVTGIMKKAGHILAIQFGEEIKGSKLLRQIQVTKDIEDEAW